MNKSIRDTLVAVFVVLGIAAGVFAYFWFSGRIESSRRRNVVVMFDDVTGLRVGDPVEVMGLPGDKVLGMALDGRRIRCRVGMDRNIRLTEDTKFAIRSVSYLGSDRYLMVTMGEGPEAQAGHVFEGTNEALNLEETFLSLDRLLTEFNPSELGEELEVKAKEVVGSISAQLGRFDTKLDRVSSDFSATADGLGMLSNSLDTLVGLLGSSSTAGKLLKTDELYQEVRKTNEAVQALIADIKQNPKRYFKFSIF